MSTKANCDNCYYRIQTRVDREIEKSTLCARYPPTVKLAMTNAGPQMFAQYPPVVKTQWCGEHRPLNEKVGSPAQDVVL